VVCSAFLQTCAVWTCGVLNNTGNQEALLNPGWPLNYSSIQCPCSVIACCVSRTANFMTTFHHVCAIHNACFAVAEKDLASLQYANLTVLQGSVTSVDVDAKVGRSSTSTT
jgi:hypothetical protein